MNTMINTQDNRNGAERSRIVRKKSLLLLKNLVPWLFAAGIIVFLLMRIDVKEFIAAFYRADIYMYGPILVFYVLACFFIDAQNIMVLLGSFGHPVPYQYALKIRGITYFLMVINYTLGMGGMAYYLKRDKNVPFLEGLGIMLFYNGATQISLFLMATMGCLLVDEKNVMMTNVLYFCVAVLTGFAVYIAGLKLWPAGKVAEKIRSFPPVGIFRIASLKTYMVMTVWRSLYYAVYMLFFGLSLRAFYINIPLHVLFAYVPIVILIMSLPITPFGLGTSQAAMLVFFSQYGSEANILAFGVTYSVGVLFLRSIIGLYFIRGAVLPKREQIITAGINQVR